MVFGDHASRMRSLIRMRPTLLTRLAFASRRAIHASGAFLHLSADANRPDKEVAEMLDNSDPRNLLLAEIPHAPTRLYGALDRAGDTVRSRSLYKRISSLCDGPLSDAIMDGKKLDDARLTWAEALLSMDACIPKMPVLWTRPTHEIESFNALIKLLRAHHVFGPEHFQIPRGSGLTAVLDRLQAS